VGPSDEEMEKLRNNLFNSSVRSRQSSQYRAQQLAEFELYDQDPELFNTDLQNYLEVTPAQISAALRRYLDTDNRVLLEIVPAPEQAAPATPQAPANRSSRLPLCRRFPCSRRSDYRIAPGATSDRTGA